MDDGFAHALQHRIDPHIAGNRRAIKQMESEMLFAIPGGLVLLVTLWMAFHPHLKYFSESPRPATNITKSMQYLRHAEG